MEISLLKVQQQSKKAPYRTFLLTYQIVLSYPTSNHTFTAVLPCCHCILIVFVVTGKRTCTAPYKSKNDQDENAKENEGEKEWRTTMNRTNCEECKPASK